MSFPSVETALGQLANLGRRDALGYTEMLGFIENLGAFVAPPVSDYVLLESGDKVTLEYGSGLLLTELISSFDFALLESDDRILLEDDSHLLIEN